VSYVLAVSDTHGNLPALTAILKWACVRADFEAALFLGDGLEDLDRASAIAGFTVPWCKVRGNIDLPAYFSPVFAAPETLTVEIDGRRLFLAHGNYHHVETGLHELAAAAEAAGAEAALYGHTHVPFCAMITGDSLTAANGGCFILNPGSAGRPRSDAGATFAVLNCPAEGSFQAVFYGLTRQGRHIEIRELNL
jgi:putative phosphoesterase